MYNIFLQHIVKNHIKYCMDNKIYTIVIGKNKE